MAECPLADMQLLRGEDDDAHCDEEQSSSAAEEERSTAKQTADVCVCFVKQFAS